MTPALIAPEAAPTDDASGPWSRIITPRRSFWEIPWRELWDYRGLLWTLTVRDLQTSYKQTVLGPFWFVVQPLIVTVVFSYLFGRMAQFESEKIPHYVFYLGGLVPWQFFSESVTKTANVFGTNAQLFSKVYFPRLIVPISAILTNIVPLAVGTMLFLGGVVVYYCKHEPTIVPKWWIVLTPLLFVQLGALALGLGCIISALTRRFRDLVYGVKIGLQLWMFGSAIVFPIARIARADRWIFYLNPVVPPIEVFRAAFCAKPLIPIQYILISTAVSFLTLLIGLIMFHRAEQTAMDTV